MSAISANSSRMFLYISGVQMVPLGGKFEKDEKKITFVFIHFYGVQIPQSTEGKYWFHYVDRTVTMEILEQLTNEFLIIYENSPSRLKKQLSTCKGLGLNSKSVSMSFGAYRFF